MLWRRAIVVVVFVLSLALPGLAPANHAQHPEPITDVVCLTTPFYSPHGGTVAAIVSVLDAAQQTILVAMYGLTHPDLVAALIGARGRGVEVAVKTDRLQSAGATQQAALGQLADAGVSVEISTLSRLLHDKFSVVDARWVITGSFNWTTTAETRNRENLMILDCPDLARNFTEEWLTILPDQP